MTEFENKLIIDHLDLVDKVIRTRIHIRPTSALMSFEDLQAVGREALCRAALHYKPQIGEFEPYAARCIYNAVIDHCKAENAICFATLCCADEEAQEAVIENASSFQPDYEGILDSQAILKILHELKNEYSGVARLGVEAIELKLLGIRTTEIAARYGTNVRNVNAWISRARSKLRHETALLNFLV